MSSGEEVFMVESFLAVVCRKFVYRKFLTLGGHMIRCLLTELGRFLAHRMKTAI